eukprot:GFUD01023378.1.p1 GENE.GFUD01023378.1~~GFUD01023378.1.p1  ORF type:complete len:228 (-),score=55.06 GFUD01023378.1:54-737(-)
MTFALCVLVMMSGLSDATAASSTFEIECGVKEMKEEVLAVLEKVEGNNIKVQIQNREHKEKMDELQLQNQELGVKMDRMEVKIDDITNLLKMVNKVATCGKDWSLFEGHCYKLLDNSGQHYSDRKMCSQDCVKAGGMLASIRSQDENAFITTILMSKWTWIGADGVGEKKFSWLDGTAWDYENWRQGDPDGSGDGSKCVCMGWNKSAPDQWIDLSCTYNNMDCVCKI